MRPLLLVVGSVVALGAEPGQPGEEAAKPTELGEAAAAMKPGEWREFPTKAMTRALQYTDHATGKRMTNSTFTWTNELCWDSVTNSIYILNAGHGQPMQFFRYTAAANAWTAEEKPAKILGTHVYNHHTATDDGVYYFQLMARPWDQHRNMLYRYDTQKREWTSEQIPKGYNVPPGMCLSFFRPLNALVQFREGGLNLYDLETKKWSRIPAKIQRGDIKKQEGVGRLHFVMTVSEPARLVIFGGGDYHWKGNSPASKTLYAMDAEKKVTRLPDAPVRLAITKVVLNSDPISGDILVVREGDLYSLDLEKKTWVQHADRKPPFTGNHIMAARIRDHGVLFFLVPKTNKVYLYKHSEKK